MLLVSLLGCGGVGGVVPRAFSTAISDSPEQGNTNGKGSNGKRPSNQQNKRAQTLGGRTDKVVRRLLWYLKAQLKRLGLVVRESPPKCHPTPSTEWENKPPQNRW